MALTVDAQAAIKEAIRIVREDKFEAYVRARQTKPADPTPPTDPPKPGDPTPPPPKPADPPKDPGPKPSAYWGELLDD